MPEICPLNTTSCRPMIGFYSIFLFLPMGHILIYSVCLVTFACVLDVMYNTLKIV